MGLAVTSRCFEPALMVLSGIARCLLSRDDVVLWGRKIIEANEDEEEIGGYLFFMLLIQHPFLTTALIGFDLNTDTLCCVGV